MLPHLISRKRVQEAQGENNIICMKAKKKKQLLEHKGSMKKSTTTKGKQLGILALISRIGATVLCKQRRKMMLMKEVWEKIKPNKGKTIMHPHLVCRKRVQVQGEKMCEGSIKTKITIYHNWGEHHAFSPQFPELVLWCHSPMAQAMCFASKREKIYKHEGSLGKKQSTASRKTIIVLTLDFWKEVTFAIGDNEPMAFGASKGENDNNQPV